MRFLVATLFDLLDHFQWLPRVAAPDLGDLAIFVYQHRGQPV